MNRAFLISTSLIVLISCSAHAENRLKPRAEVNVRAGQERSTLLTEFWVPIVQNEDDVLYGDLRYLGDDQQNQEGNIGIGYRSLEPDLDAVVGAHAWIDRRETDRGSTFYQTTLGVEWLGDIVDARVNGYIPLSDEEEYATGSASDPYLAGTGIFVNQIGTLIEEPQSGVDGEIGLRVPLLEETVDSIRAYGGGYYFDGDKTDKVAGWRTRLAVDISPAIQLGGRYQNDEARGSHGFVELTVRFPFDSKRSFRKQGISSRMDESPERDIDIVTDSVVSDDGVRQVINTETGQVQQVLHVDNTAAAGGNGSVENPYNALADAEASSQAHGIIYVHEGSGTTGQDTGIALNKDGQSLIGSGIDFVWDNNRFGIRNQNYAPGAVVLASATQAPVLTNFNGGAGVSVSADNVLVTGITVDGADRDGILVSASGAGASAQNIRITNVETINNRTGIYIHGADSASVSASVERTVATNNTQHGMAVYDDTAGSFNADLGGGNLNSDGLNVLANNGLEDLAVDYDGGTLAAQNNWWGQAGGPNAGNASLGIKPQIYYGAPIEDGLQGHWTFDSNWMNGNIVYDRTLNNNDGTMFNGAGTVAGQIGNALSVDGANDYAVMSGSSYPSGSTARTLVMWINSPDTVYDSNADHIVNYGNAATNQAFGNMIYVGDNWWFYGHSSADINTNVPVTTGWHQHAITYDGSVIRYYLDGTQIGQTSAMLNTHSGNMTFGLRPDLGAGNYYNGLIDDVRIYNQSYDANSISQLYRMSTSSNADTSGFLSAAP